VTDSAEFDVVKKTWNVRYRRLVEHAAVATTVPM